MFEQLLLQTVFLANMTFKAPDIFIAPQGPTLMGSRPKPPPPIKKPSLVAPVLAAESVLAYDIASDTILFQKNIHEHRKIASISKLMTAIVILEHHGLHEKVIIPREATKVEPVKMWLLPGEEMTIENLLYGLLIHSGNDAAKALALIDSLTEQNFVAKMNQRGQELGLTNTHFTNATGLDDRESYSSAHDVLLMSLHALKFDFIRQAVKIPQLEIRSTDGKLSHKLETTNELLGNKNFPIYGLKTGNTLGAGPSLVALTSITATTPPSKNHTPHEIITIILGSPDRFQETKILMDWVFRAYEWK